MARIVLCTEERYLLQVPEAHPWRLLGTGTRCLRGKEAGKAPKEQGWLGWAKLGRKGGLLGVGLGISLAHAKSFRPSNPS